MKLKFFDLIFKRSSFFVKKIYRFIRITKRRIYNLYDTNIKTIDRYIDKGKLSDAIIRIKIIKFFYPKNTYINYKYAYCLALYGFYPDAISELQKIILQDPNYTNAQILLDQIKSKKFNKTFVIYNIKHNIDFDINNFRYNISSDDIIKNINQKNETQNIDTNQPKENQNSTDNDLKQNIQNLTISTDIPKIKNKFNRKKKEKIQKIITTNVDNDNEY